MSDDVMPRPPGCLCTWEEGDSECPVHPTCPECGCVFCECDVDVNELALREASP